MRILLLGSTGNLGSRLVPALLHHSHIVTVLVRAPTKLASILPDELSSHSNLTVETGDATDASRIEAVLEQHDIEGIVNTAGNQVLPWKEFQLEKIAAAVCKAAIKVGEKRGVPLRAWFLGGLPSMDIPNTEGRVQLQDYFPKLVNKHINQHRGTYAILTATPTSALRWSLLCVFTMLPLTPSIPTKTSFSFSSSSPPPSHDLLTSIDEIPAWSYKFESGWPYYISKIPFVGWFLFLVLVTVRVSVTRYWTRLEEVADLLAEDFEMNPGGGKYLGKRVAMIERRRLKSSSKKVE